MKTRWVVTGVLVGAMAMVSGCLEGYEFGFPYGGAIPDGAYTGNFTAVSEYWVNDEIYERGAGDGDTYAEFYGGELLGESGDVYDLGDVEEDLDVDYLNMSRTVSDIEVDGSFYTVTYDVSAWWGSFPMTGTEYISYDLNSDGSVLMFDSIVVSAVDSAGDLWQAHISGSATLYPEQPNENPPFHIPGSIFDQKSGKTKRSDP